MVMKVGSEARVEQVCKSLATSSEAFLGLCALGTHGATAVGSYSLQLEEIQQTSTSGVGPSVGVTRDLLPIPVSIARSFLTDHYCRSGEARDADVVDAALGSLAAHIAATSNLRANIKYY